MSIDNTLFLQHLRDSSLDEGRAYIQAHIDELADHAAIGDLLADEALKQLYSPFLSLKLAELLIFFGEFAQDMYSHALGLKARGDALVQISHYQAALESLDTAGEEFLCLGDEENWARTRISWIAASAWLGHVEEAIQHADQAREVFQRCGQNYWVCIIDHNTAVIYSHTGRYRDALEMYEKMLEIFPTLSDQSETFIKRSIAMAEVNQGLNLARLGKFEQAYRPLQRARDSFIALEEPNHVANTEIHLAELDYTRGYYGSALRRYYQAQDILMRNDVTIPSLLAELKLQMANALVKLNRVNEACELAYQAVELFRQLDVSLPASNALREYASALVAAGRLQEAVVALNEAWALFNQGGFDHHASATKLQQVEILLEIGSVAEAYDEARTLKEYFETRGLVARSIRASMVMAGSLLEQAQQAEKDLNGEQQVLLIQEAMLLCKRVVLRARQHHLQEEVYKSQYLLGRLNALQGDTTRAIKHFAAAIAQIERILDDLVFDLSPSFLHAAWVVYEDMIALCLQQGKIELAYSYLERARSMALRQYLSTSWMITGERKNQQDSESTLEQQAATITKLGIQHELASWQERYHDYSVLLTQLDTTVSPTVEREIIEAELRRCEAKLSELFERFYLQRAASRPVSRLKRGERSTAKRLDAAQLRQRLSPDQLLLAYFLYKGKLVIFAATNEQLTAYEIADGMKRLHRLVPLLHAHLQPGGWPNSEQPPQQGIRHMLSKLYQLLLAPVQALLPPRHGHLTIVPYGPLHTLPFHALYNGTHYLIEDYQINYLPAGNLLKSPAKSEFTSRDHRGHGTSATGHRPPLVFGYSGHGHLQRTLEEAKMLAAMLGGRRYLEEEATISRLVEEAAGSPIIHLATHGHSRLDAPNFSSVLLADGRFNAIDAFSLNLNGCELVTLSGCETGLALSGGGDEQLGLGRAFLAAGASALVMSLWPVEDNATNELMQLFYQNLLLGESKAQALQKAQCTLMRRSESSYTHPYYWAAFRLVGDVGPLKYGRVRELSVVPEIHSVKSGS